jgi:hypothetical protein
LFFISIHSAADDDGDPIHAISLKITSCVAEWMPSENEHDAASVDVEVDADVDVDMDEEVAAAASSERLSVASFVFCEGDALTACADSDVDVGVVAPMDPCDAPDFVALAFFRTDFFADDGDEEATVGTASSLSVSRSIAASDDDGALSEMVSIPALFIPRALLIAEG